jgi:predicted N-formylglutamate amidohydrolase
MERAATDVPRHLLAAHEPPPVLARRRDGRSAFVIVVDHASRRIPKCLATLGLAQSDLERHIAWDIGALAVAQSVSAALDAPLVAQNYSRLVIDCNRRPDEPTSIPTISESTPIPGNLDLPAEQLSARRHEIFEPYHQHLSALLEERVAAGRRTILIVQHSMTNVFKGVRREMHAAVLYNRDRRFADCLLEALRSEGGLVVGDNEPYSGKQEIGYTLPHHGERRGIPHVEVEIRQDLIQLPSGQAEWSRRMTVALLAAEQAFLRKFS